MRTTVTLDADVTAAIRGTMHERNLTFSQALNDAVRAGLSLSHSSAVSFPTYDMGVPLVEVTKTLQLAGDLEDEGIATVRPG